MNTRKGLLLPVMNLLLICAGCSHLPGPKPNDPEFAPPMPDMQVTTVAQPGSLYNPGTASYLFEDRRATRVGDLITIRLTENTQAQKKADTKIKKEDETGVSAPVILGRPNPSLDGGKWSLETEVQADRDFKTNANSKQSNSLTGTVTVMISQVLPNGNLVIRGEKWVNINQGEEFIRITGIVRPSDVATDNSVPSTRVANARISYSGTGQMAEANSRGWLARFFSTDWFPL